MFSTMHLFHASFSATLLRFYLMMALVIAGFFLQQYWMIVLAIPVFLSCLLGISFSRDDFREQSNAIMHLMKKRKKEDQMKEAA